MNEQVLDSDLHLNSAEDTLRSAPRGWRAGDLVVDLELRRVRIGAERVVLQETPFRLLCLLLERGGRPVSRHEMHHALWPRYDWDSFERNLNTAVRKLRRAIGDDAREPRCIETLRASGYRWIGATPDALRDVPWLDPRSEPSKPALVAATVVGRGAAGRWLAAAAAVAMLAGVAVAYWPNAAGKPWLTVEVADAVGGSIADSASARALVQILHNGLLDSAARDGAGSVHVALTIRGGDVVSAEVRGRAEPRRVTLGGAVYGGERLLAEVASRLPDAALRRADQTLAGPAERAFTDAGSLMVGASGTAVVERAVGLLETVLTAAPEHTGALRSYARAQRMLAVLHRDPAKAAERRRVAHDALRRAVIADPGSAAVAIDVAGQLFWGEWNGPQAAEWFDLARRMAPQDADVLHAYAWFALADDRVDSAMQAMNQALTIAPLSVELHSDLGWFYFRTGRYDDSLRQCRIALEMAAAEASAQICEERSLAELGRLPEAWAALRRHAPQWLDADTARRLDAQEPAAAYAAAMHRYAAVVRAREGAGYDSACLEAIAGEREAATADLAAAVALRDPGLHLARVTPELVRLLGDSGARRLAGDDNGLLASTVPEG